MWNQFVLAHGPRSGRFLQSWEWGEFQKAVGEEVRREVFVEDGETMGIAQWIDRVLPLFRGYSFCPKGPIGVWQPRTSPQMFLRVEPFDSDLPTYARKTIDLSPAHTRITDVSMSEEDLLVGMHPKTRYNIRVAQKHGVRVDLASHDFEAVWTLFEQTSSRGQFRLHRKAYYKQMLESLTGGDCRAFLATAFSEGNLLAANIMIDFGDTRTYLHGASSNEHRNLMGPYLLHWELMRDAHAEGLRWYDWWGVAPMNALEDHPWSGISRFKRGFIGEEVASPGTHDIVLKPCRYHLYQFARRIRRII
ncbi:MAG: Methicillin resistance protein [Candidatus Uhrbacteria bacterium GW2011_GWA2_52_8d]|uniref:Methicillin resistance protein n=1 Tax=Candidatus Uhrbacteria bacterium GW2011_GWA2_52_8d TaxID=1618979 RepID=A0A0G1XQK5_9BACT|nr:MAG: Methicillin resistance protein [Candidatus Uhrbacteria bacterium GW2011_GWA2_52_8d]